MTVWVLGRGSWNYEEVGALLREEVKLAPNSAPLYGRAVGATRKILQAGLLFASLVATFPLSTGVGWKIFWGLLLFVALSYFAQTVTHRRSKRLTRTITVEQAESEHLEIHENHKWRGLLLKMREKDALWKFVSPAQQRGGVPCDVGIAIVRAGKMAAWIWVSRGKRPKTRPFRCGCGNSRGNVRRSKSFLST